MNIRIVAGPIECTALLEFLTSDTWPYHGNPNPTPEAIKSYFESGFYTGPEVRCFWIIDEDQGQKIGFIRIYDLQDETPLFDLRLQSKYRGRGIGTKAVKWLVDYIFQEFDHVSRIEGNTRQDNYAMRAVFNASGFTKEAHHRQAWKDKNGKKYDSIGYCILKDDWLSGNITSVQWDDYKY